MLILAIDLALRNSGIVLLDQDRKIIAKTVLKIPKKYNLENNTLEIIKIISNTLENIFGITKWNDVEGIELVIELPKTRSTFSLIAGLIIPLINNEITTEITKIKYIDPKQWQSKLLPNYKVQLGSERIKELIRIEASKDIDITNWTQDEIDAYMIGKWYINERKK